MAHIYSPWEWELQKGNTTVLETEREYLVKYPVENRPDFHMIFRVKPNPIGFIWRKQ